MSERDDLVDLMWNCVLEPTSADKLKAELLTEYASAPERTVGGRRVHVLPSGFVIVRHGSKRVALYESRWLYDRRMLELDWQEFHKGGWYEGITPDKPGLYFTRSQDEYRGIRTIARTEDGGLKDTACGLLPSGVVSDWQGAWWLPAVPRLPDSK